MAWQFLVGQGLLIIEISRSPPDKTLAVGLLSTGVQSVSEIPTCQHTTLTRQIFMNQEGFAPANPAGE